MEIKQAVFVTSIGQLSQMKDFGKPEIAIAGKSNVGKSSFINFIANNKSLAKTSSTPGRTRLINYFELKGLNNIKIYNTIKYGHFISYIDLIKKFFF